MKIYTNWFAPIMPDTSKCSTHLKLPFNQVTTESHQGRFQESPSLHHTTVAKCQLRIMTVAGATAAAAHPADLLSAVETR